MDEFGDGREDVASDEMDTDLEGLGSEGGLSTNVQDSLLQFYGSSGDVFFRYSHCGMCGAHLHFSYNTDFSSNLTTELAKCPECAMQLRQMMHRLQ